MQRHATHWVTLSVRGVNSRKYDISVRIRYLDKLVVRFHISITWTLGVPVIDIIRWIHLRFVPQEKSILYILQKHLTPAESLWSVPFARALSPCAFISSTLYLLRCFSRAFIVTWTILIMTFAVHLMLHYVPQLAHTINARLNDPFIPVRYPPGILDTQPDLLRVLTPLRLFPSQPWYIPARSKPDTWSSEAFS